MLRERQALSRLLAAPWAARKEPVGHLLVALHAAANGINARPRGHREEAEARAAARENAQRTVEATRIGVVRIHGLILDRRSWITEYLELATCEGIGEQFEEFARDDDIEAIILDVDSPGGIVYGLPELADQIRAARSRKPIVAQVWPMAASAAYFLASQAHEIVVIPSGAVGSIGVWIAHTEWSRYLEKEGITTTMIRSGKYKAEMNPWEPLSEDAREYQQQQNDEYYRQFLSAVARGRGVGQAVVRRDYGEGRMLLARPAVEIGMADRVGTFEDTVRRLATAQGRTQVTSRRRSHDTSALSEVELELARINIRGNAAV